MVRSVVVMVVSVGLVMAACALAQPGSDSLERVCPVDWRGVPLREALVGLAGRLEVAHILDPSVDPAALDRNVRMSAWHLTGEQGFRWLARSAGLAAVLVDGTFLVAAEDRLPVVWRAAGKGLATRPAEEDDARWQRVRGRRADIHWVDAPLSGVARDVAGVFEVDVIFHPAILTDQRLVCLDASQVGLDGVFGVLAEQLGARVGFLDGAVWVCPADDTSPRLPATAPAGVGEVGEARAPAAGPLNRRVRIDRSITTWAAFAARLSEAGGVSYRIEVAPGAVYPGIEAAGSVAALLEAARLVGRLSWGFEQTGPDQGPMLRLRVPEIR